MKQQELPSLLDPELGKVAIDLAPHGVREYAFPLHVAQRVLDEITRGGGVVLGGDLWLINDDGFLQPGHDNWFVNRIPDESLPDFVARQTLSASEFLERQEDEGRSFVTFVLSLGE